MFRDELITALLSSPIIFVSHFDYNMVDAELKAAIQAIKRKDEGVNCILEHHPDRGVVYFESKYNNNNAADLKETTALLESICDDDKKRNQTFKDERVFVFKGVNSTILSKERVQSALLTFAAKYRKGCYEEKKDPIYCIVIVTPMPVSQLPFEIEKVVNVVEFRLPTMQDIKKLIEQHERANSAKRNDSFVDELTRSLLGLQEYEIQHILKTIDVRSPKGLNQQSLKWALEEKKKIVKKSGVIEVVETDVSMDDIGGLERLKEDLRNKSTIYRNLNEVQSPAINLPLPKGVLIIGMPGCGKSLIAKAVASEFGVSLLRLDMNRLMGQYVGMSEENMRRALQTAETAHPCVLWIDEVEKAFAGAGAGGESDMLVQRLMGQFLTWMQERKTAVYIVATANDVMRPEFMRKGRFDEVYFVDFPNVEERKSILEAKLKRFGYKNGDNAKNTTIYDFSALEKEEGCLKTIAEKMSASQKPIEKGKFEDGFSGAEIESSVNLVMEKAYIRYRGKFKDGKPTVTNIPVTIADFEKVINELRPSIMAKQITTEEERKRNPYKQTNIERIREMQNTYHFTKATF